MIYWSVPIFVWARPTFYSSNPIDFWVVPIIYWYRPIGIQYNWSIKICETAKKSWEHTKKIWEPIKNPVSQLWYADDIDIIGLRLSYVAETYQGIEQAAKNLWLQVNGVKTKLMVAISEPLTATNPSLCRRDVQIGERTFEVVPEFTYLGSKVTNDNCVEAELCANRFTSVHFKECSERNLMKPSWPRLTWALLRQDIVCSRVRVFSIERLVIQN